MGEKGNMPPYLKPIERAQTTQLIDGNRYQLFCDFLSFSPPSWSLQRVDWLLFCVHSKNRNRFLVVVMGIAVSSYSSFISTSYCFRPPKSAPGGVSLCRETSESSCTPSAFACTFPITYRSVINISMCSAVCSIPNTHQQALPILFLNTSAQWSALYCPSFNLFVVSFPRYKPERKRRSIVLE